MGEALTQGQHGCLPRTESSTTSGTGHWVLSQALQHPLPHASPPQTPLQPWHTLCPALTLEMSPASRPEVH